MWAPQQYSNLLHPQHCFVMCRSQTASSNGGSSPRMIIVGSITGNNNTVAGTIHGLALELDSQLPLLTQPVCNRPLDVHSANLLSARSECDVEQQMALPVQLPSAGSIFAIRHQQ